MNIVLPDGMLCALTWSIPRQFGGLTKSLLQRSCQLATASGREVVVITLAAQQDLDAVRASLRERGLLVDGVSLLNLWEDLAQADDDVWDSASFDPSITTPVLDTSGPAGPPDEVGEITRPDGSILARQRWETLGETSSLTKRGDEVVRTEIWDRQGTFRGGWHGVWPLWRWWLDRVIPRPAHMIVDSANAADCVAAAPLPDVSTTYVVHNSHVAGSRDAPYGRLERWRSFTIVRAERFDAVVHLTHAQRDHVDLLFGHQDNAHVLPHAIETATTKPNRRRPAGRGIVMANLDGRKRIPHAVRAVAAAARTAPSVELIIYGRGSERDAVLAEIEESGAPARLEGYTSDPAGAFADSSYMLLTSSREGFGLVLVESMAAGCLPISYDIEYGPADIVNDGVDGYLVPRADEKALAARVADVAGASRWRLRRMRKAARRRAAEFLPAAVLPQWGPVLDAATERARDRTVEAEPSLEELRELERTAGLHRFADCRLEATATDVSWDGRGVATLVVSCAVIGAGARRGRPEIDVQLVHRPTGTRSAPLAVDTVDADPSSEHPTTVLRVTIDPAAVDQPADHVLLARARLGHIDVLDSVQPLPETPAWFPLPAASSVRPVLIPARRSGVRLVTASPRAAGSVELSADRAVLEVTGIADGAAVQSVDAKGIDDEPTLTAELLADGRHRLTVPTAGSWKVRARVDGQWRNVAWRGPEPFPSSTGPVHVELSPRGYVRLRRH
ncbi:MAG: glycosyltransferase [Aeromicrobium sp.]